MENTHCVEILYKHFQMENKCVGKLSDQLFKHITKLRLRYFDQHPIGMLVTRSVSDMETVADVFSQGVLVILGDLLKLTTSSAK